MLELNAAPLREDNILFDVEFGLSEHNLNK